MPVPEGIISTSTGPAEPTEVETVEEVVEELAPDEELDQA